MHISYYLTIMLMVVWVVHIRWVVNAHGISLAKFFLAHKYGLAFALIITAIIFVSVRVEFKILSDETNLLSVSRSMLMDKTVGNVIMVTYYEGLHPISTEIPKRPLAFPFLVNIIHTVTGFRYQNAFALNFIVLFFMLSGVFVMARKFVDTKSSVAAVLLVVSYPAVSIYATTGGFDLLNTALFILVLGLSHRFIMNPSGPLFGLLMATILVFSNVRYESAIFLLVVPILLAPCITLAHLRSSIHLFLSAPLLLLPNYWQRYFATDFAVPESESLFSWVSFTKHLPTFVQNQFDFSGTLPYASIINVLALAGVLVFLAEVARGSMKLTRKQLHWAIFLATVILLNAGIFLSYHFGLSNHPISARYFLSFCVVFALLPLILRILTPRIMSGVALLTIAIISFLYYHPFAVKDDFTRTLAFTKSTRAALRSLSGLDRNNMLIISERPSRFTAMGYGAVSIVYANKNMDAIFAQNKLHLYSRVIVFEEFLFNGDAKALRPDYKRNIIKEEYVAAGKFLRYSNLDLAWLRARQQSDD